ncbi:putative DCC family thiol-disulfide oxidoreductase YuxK [Nocardiopsis mwathae]|uniref:Putative DCC family thiol-disulfide oxidoreductase YuxK n=1 Tax=Nocardiopsis mwathae TaxID=1472723 RepID=A0A7W9YKC2_9ACTN|nr:DUF393 domain-containing protein [Nocardiopsis mwathae]MBB6173755.1 putative DCC family thiol-disulfide oxidoreductase YuxK [Nocardiopsis mwathae]
MTGEGRTAAAPMLVYDGDCGFCTRTVRLAERLPVRADLIPWQEADLVRLGVSEERAAHEVLWVEPSGRVEGGADAVAEVFRHARRPWPLLGGAMKLPVIRSAAVWGYRRIAANRYRLPGATPACRLPPAERPGARGAPG